MFRRDKETPAATPVVPPRPSPEELENSVTHSLNRENAGMSTVSQENNDVTGELAPKTKRTGVMGVMQKVNPFKSTTQVSSTVSKASSSESLEQGTASDSTQNPGMLRGVMQKVNPFKSTSQVSSTVNKATSSDSLGQENPPDVTQNPGMLTGVMQKVNPFKSSSQGSSVISKTQSSESLEQRSAPDSTSNPGMLKGVIQKVNPFKSSAQVLKENPPKDSEGPTGTGKQLEDKQSRGMFGGMMQKVNPFKSSTQMQDTPSLHSDLSSSAGSLADDNTLTEKQVPTGDCATDTVDYHATKQNPGMFKGMMQKVNPFKSYTPIPKDSQVDSPDSEKLPAAERQSIHSDHSSSSGSLDESTIDRHSVWYTDINNCEVKSQPKEAEKKKTMTFRIKRILPGVFGSGTKNAATGPPDSQHLAQGETVEVRTLEMAEIPTPSEGTVIDPLDDEDGLMSWWRTVENWDQWNESNQEEDAEEVVEDAADRVFMAARLFVRLFNRRGASLQQRILELLAVADAADIFHKKTVTASVGGGVASVAGSVTTITGLILAPFTMGTSLIVTAVGIGVATAGGVASASANITDTVHSKTDRKKVEKMIQDYQEEMKDIKECLEFMQEGMETLEEWNFEAYAESISKKHLNQNVKHVMKEGGRAGKALLINTESLISTVQVISVAGSAAKAAQVMSVTTGVMSGLFLALDVFFLAKDSLELKKGAKTEFAAKIREVCKDLQDGLLELNRIKEQLQKTMDGIEVEMEEEEDEDALESDLKKLAQLEE
ncbi:uncharacterized protein LOC130131003 [Lampris incognitus]|uniref:uncharacterized protein LOC130131003 n=1 Tax=Lampris incognitus TaxID=2546036 RepID=UPI0024B60680|nr:uncharacterized protein LOC130131003 [Lampris incognitus]